jgi:hypothetical protein
MLVPGRDGGCLGPANLTSARSISQGWCDAPALNTRKQMPNSASTVAIPPANGRTVRAM